MEHGIFLKFALTFCFRPYIPCFCASKMSMVFGVDNKTVTISIKLTQR